MTPAEAVAAFHEREWRIDSGIWATRCLGHTTSTNYLGRYITLWQPIAGPFIDGVDAWRLGESSDPVVRPGYDNPTNAIIPRYYPADVRDGRIAIKLKSDVARDWYRLTGERVPRLDRFPAQGFDRRVALVEVIDVTHDGKKRPCPVYTRINAVLGPIPVEALSNECGKNDGDEGG